MERKMYENYGEAYIKEKLEEVFDCEIIVSKNKETGEPFLYSSPSEHVRLYTNELTNDKIDEHVLYVEGFGVEISSYSTKSLEAHGLNDCLTGIFSQLDTEVRHQIDKLQYLMELKNVLFPHVKRCDC